MLIIRQMSAHVSFCIIICGLFAYVNILLLNYLITNVNVANDGFWQVISTDSSNCIYELWPGYGKCWYLKYVSGLVGGP